MGHVSHLFPVYPGQGITAIRSGSRSEPIAARDDGTLSVRLRAAQIYEVVFSA